MKDERKYNAERDGQGVSESGTIVHTHSETCVGWKKKKLDGFTNIFV